MSTYDSDGHQTDVLTHKYHKHTVIPDTVSGKTFYELASIPAGAGVIPPDNLPQDLRTSASPTFVNLTLTGSLLASSGTLTLGGTGNTNNENLTFDFETEANVVHLSTGTSVDRIETSSLNIGVGGWFTTAQVANSIGTCMQLVGDGATCNLGIFAISNTASDVPGIKIFRARGSVGSESKVLSADTVFAIAGYGYADVINDYALISIMAVTATGNFDSAVNTPVEITFYSHSTTAILTGLTVKSDGDVWIGGNSLGGSDNRKWLSGAAGDMGMYYNGSAGVIDTSLVAASDLTVSCGTDKTLALSETVWDDLRVPLTATKLGAVNDPNFAKIQDDGAGSTGVFAYLFDKNAEEEVFFIAQFPHAKKNGTNVIPHIHWAPTDANTDTVRWGLEYTWADINGTLGNTTIIYAEDAGDGTADKHQYITFAAITGSGITNVSSIMVCRIFRDAAHANDTYDADAALLEIDFHYEIDTMGSRQELVK